MAVPVQRLRLWNIEAFMPLTFLCGLMMLQAAIKGVRKVIARASDEEVATALSEGSLLRSLFVAFGHEVADVRKAVTFCLVDLRLVCFAFANPVWCSTYSADDMN